MKSELEAALEWHLKAAGIEYQREYKAIVGRGFRWDFRINDLLIEVQGGTWIKGGHTTGKGLARDYQKNNLAVLAGWRVLYFDAEMVTSGKALATIQRALTPPGSYKNAKGVLPWKEGDELPEDVVRRMRGG